MNQEQAELQVLNSNAQLIAEQLNRIESGLAEIEFLKNNLNELKNVKKDTEILSPVSSGIFAKARLNENNKLLVNVGNSVVVEKTIEQTKELLDERINEMIEAREKMMDQMKKIQERLVKLEK